MMIWLGENIHVIITENYKKWVYHMSIKKTDIIINFTYVCCFYFVKILTGKKNIEKLREHFTVFHVKLLNEKLDKFY